MRTNPLHLCAYDDNAIKYGSFSYMARGQMTSVRDNNGERDFIYIYMSIGTRPHISVDHVFERQY